MSGRADKPNLVHADARDDATRLFVVQTGPNERMRRLA
jgi:hypothetical protein